MSYHFRKKVANWSTVSGESLTSRNIIVMLRRHDSALGSPGGLVDTALAVQRRKRNAPLSGLAPRRHAMSTHDTPTPPISDESWEDPMSDQDDFPDHAPIFELDVPIVVHLHGTPQARAKARAEYDADRSW